MTLMVFFLKRVLTRFLSSGIFKQNRKSIEKPELAFVCKRIHEDLILFRNKNKGHENIFLIYINDLFLNRITTYSTR